MIEISVGTLIGCTEALNELIKKPLRIRTAYKIARIAREIQHELDLFNSTKETLVKKYGETDEQGNLIVNNDNSYQIKKEHQIDFVKEFQEMTAQTIKLNFEPLTLAELEEEKFTPQEVSSIIDFIEEE